MAIILAQVVLESDSGLPEDRITNTLHFNGAATVPVAVALAAAIENLYNVPGGAGVPIGGYLSLRVKRIPLVHAIKFYDVTAGPAGTPFYTHAWTIAPAQTPTSLPEEVSVCLSFKANPLAGAIESRRRGRIFIGPLNITALAGTSQRTAPDADLVLDFLDAADRLFNLASAAGAPWVIYSRVNDSTALVQIAWVDNSFDTQRRRGPATTTRTTRVLS